MNKTLTALAVSAAVSAALTAPVIAKADVTIYGQARLALDYVNDGNFTNAAGADFSKEWRARVSSYSSRLGFKGFEDLGGGLKAIWQIETEVDMDGDGPNGTGPTSTGSAFSLRNTFAGLQSPFGTVMLGRHDTPFKIAVRDLDFFADTLADNRSLTRGGVLNNSWDFRAPDMVAYITPDIMGAKLLGAYVAGAEEFSNVVGLAPGNGNATKGDAYSVAGIYKNGPIYASLAYERHNFGSPDTGSLGSTGALSGKEEEAARAGVGLEFGPAKIGGMFQRTDDNLGGACGRGVDDSCLAHNVWDLGASVAFGPSALKAQYTRATATSTSPIINPNGDNKAWQWSVGLDHNLSKRTQVYALWTHLHNDNNSALSLTSGSNQSTTDPLAPQGVGANPEGFSVGINHKF